VCCPGTSCIFEKPGIYSCHYKTDARTVVSTSCTDPAGRCSIRQLIDTWCTELGVSCTEYTIGPCCEIDDDRDGFTSAACGGPDCNDDPNSGGADINPEIREICNDGVDNNCNGIIDTGGFGCTNPSATRDECTQLGVDYDPTYNRCIPRAPNDESCQSMLGYEEYQ